MRRPLSMAAACVRLSQRIFDSIADQHVLFIGAGEMIELCAAHFAAHNPKSVTIANRTMERGEALATRYNGSANFGLLKVEHDLNANITLREVPRTVAASRFVVCRKGSVTSR